MANNDFGPAVFQSFDTKTSPKTVAARLKALRAAMLDAGLDGFLVPRADAHRGESVPESEARLAYVTSFTGSAGFAVIGPTVASNTAGGTFSAGATGTAITGVFYMPNGALKFDGAATLGNSVGGCLEMIGKSVSVTQGSLLGSACVSSGGAASLKVRLVG